jgi:putative transposase
LGVHRSGYYYKPVRESESNKALMEAIDRIYTSCPYYGSRKITQTLRRMPEWSGVNRKRISRLMSLMGISAIYPKPRTSGSRKEHEKYPYLMKGVSIEGPNQVWCTDITYIPTAKGYVYLAAIMDWHSRYILSWEVSNSMESSFCVRALEQAIQRYGSPGIFNSDQGTQFTDRKFIEVLERNGIRISMDGRGRCMDNIFIERLWRSVKYEEVYLKSYATLAEARTGLREYFEFYNNKRLHQSLEYKTPAEVHFGQDGKGAPQNRGAIFLNSAA